jgi:hypothetical protein
MPKRTRRTARRSTAEPLLVELPEASGSLIEHLHSIYLGDREMPTTSASKHHFVAQMQLARFTKPATVGRPKLWVLDKQTGSCEQFTARGIAWERNLYTAYGEQGERNTQLESLFGLFEMHAAESIERLLLNPGDFLFGDRVNLSMFLALQEQRTPAALDAMEEILGQMGTMFGCIELTNSPRRRQRAADARQAILDGRVVIRPPEGMRLRMLLDGIHGIAPAIHQMCWQLQRAQTGEFVISDCPLTMHDPAPRHAFTGHAWQSSPAAYATLPLSPEACLRVDGLHPLELLVRDVERQVGTTNLRTYGWAQRYVMARSKDVLLDLHAQACANPNVVPKQKPRHFVLMEDADTADPAEAARNKARGWDPHVIYAPDGAPAREMSYRVIESLTDARESMAPRPR